MFNNKTCALMKVELYRSNEYNPQFRQNIIINPNTDFTNTVVNSILTTGKLDHAALAQQAGLNMQLGYLDGQNREQVQVLNGWNTSRYRVYLEFHVAEKGVTHYTDVICVLGYTDHYDHINLHGTREPVYNDNMVIIVTNYIGYRIHHYSRLIQARNATQLLLGSVTDQITVRPEDVVVYNTFTTTLNHLDPNFTYKMEHSSFNSGLKPSEIANNSPIDWLTTTMNTNYSDRTSRTLADHEFQQRASLSPHGISLDPSTINTEHELTGNEVHSVLNHITGNAFGFNRTITWLNLRSIQPNVSAMATVYNMPRLGHYLGQSEYLGSGTTTEIAARTIASILPGVLFKYNVGYAIVYMTNKTLTGEPMLGFGGINLDPAFMHQAAEPKPLINSVPLTPAKLQQVLNILTIQLMPLLTIGNTQVVTASAECNVKGDTVVTVQVEGIQNSGVVRYVLPTFMETELSSNIYSKQSNALANNANIISSLIDNIDITTGNGSQLPTKTLPAPTSPFQTSAPTHQFVPTQPPTGMFEI